jgi:hypothetical protein
VQVPGGKAAAADDSGQLDPLHAACRLHPPPGGVLQVLERLHLPPPGAGVHDSSMYYIFKC